MSTDIPILTKYSIETWSAWAAFHVVVATFIITIIGLVATVVLLYMSMRQYAQVKTAEAMLKQAETAQSRFENAQYLIKLCDSGQSNAYAVLAAIEALSQYPEYFHTYEYMLENIKTYPKSLTNDRLVEAAIRLINKTRPANQ